MAYSDAALVRSMCRKLTTAIISDVQITYIITNLADPIIDGALRDQGAPFTTPGALIKAISALLTIGYCFDDAYAQTGDESQFGQKKRDQAMDLLKRINEGELDPGCLTGNTVGDLEVSALDDEWPEQMVFVGGYLDWKDRSEDRAE